MNHDRATQIVARTIAGGKEFNGYTLSPDCLGLPLAMASQYNQSGRNCTQALAANKTISGGLVRVWLWPLFNQSNVLLS